MTCALCLSMDGRFQAANECCQLRLLARAPDKQREQVYERTQQVAGAAAVAELKGKVAAECRRQLAITKAALRRAEEERQRETEERKAKGRVHMSALLQKIKVGSMHLSPMQRAAQTGATQPKEFAR